MCGMMDHQRDVGHQCLKLLVSTATSEIILGYICIYIFFALELDDKLSHYSYLLGSSYFLHVLSNLNKIMTLLVTN